MDKRSSISYLMKYDKYTDFIEHSGVSGMSWYHHDPKRRQQGEKAYKKGRNTEGFIVKLLRGKKKKKDTEEDQENQNGTLRGIGDLFDHLQGSLQSMKDNTADKKRKKDEKTGLYLKNREFTEEEDCSLINPNLKKIMSLEIGKPMMSLDDEDGSYSNNCVSCSVAYEMRRRGYDVESVPDKVGKRTPQIDDLFPSAKRKDLYNMGSKYSDYASYLESNFKKDPNASLTTLYTNYINQASENVVNNLLKQGDGASGILGLSLWYGGHAVHYSVNNGNVTITDGQVGEQHDAYDYLTDFGATKVSCYRLDNVSPKTEQLYKFVRNRE